MRANPGGEIDPKDVVGRDQFIQTFWQILDRQSVILVSERRMGKSCVIKKMRAEDADRHLIYYADVEGLETPLDFAERVCRDVDKHLTWRQKTKSRANAVMKKVAGAEIGKLVKFPPAAAELWRDLIEASLADLAQHQPRQVIFFWDELPLMLQKIAHTSGEPAAMAILDVLRSMRQTHGRVRMTYTGSIGLHHVLSTLRDAGHTNDATNDMQTVELPPISCDDAQFLAAQLILGEDLECADPLTTARSLAELTDCIPFYIHQVILAMRNRGVSASTAIAATIVQEALQHSQDPWHLRHFRERLETYYGANRVPIVLYLLDTLATEDCAVPLETLLKQFGAHFTRGTNKTVQQILQGDREPLRRILELLQADHYVCRRAADGAYMFRFPLIKRWWQFHRSLPC